MKKKWLGFWVFILIFGLLGCGDDGDLSGDQKLDSVPYREFVTIPAGSYEQKPTSGNTFSHTVSSFRLAKHQVSYELWRAVYTWAKGKGYQFANPGREGNNGLIGNAPGARKHEPVTTINWRDAIVWCNAYSELSGLTPVYYSDSGFTTPLKEVVTGAIT